MKISLPAAALAAALLAPSLPAVAASATPTTPAQAPRLNPVLVNAKSFSVTETQLRPNTQGKLVVVGTLRIQYQGSKFRADVHSSSEDFAVDGGFAVSDGVQTYLYHPAKLQYTKLPAGAGPGSKERHDLRHDLEILPSGKPVRTMLDGKPALLFQQYSPVGHRFIDRSWMDTKTHLLQQESSYDLSSGRPVLFIQTNFTDWKINPVIPASRFVFVPPAGAKEVVADTPPAQPVLLANGTLAPDFAVQDKSGKPVHLSDYKGKVVVLDFWATWCGPCQQSLPHTQSVAAQFAPQGVVVLAVNVWDTKPAFDKWLPAHAAFRSIAFAFDPSPDAKRVTNAYNVSGIPTQYIIGKDGKITQSFVGYDGPSEDLANAITSALKG